jgi:hypothetical protein
MFSVRQDQENDTSHTRRQVTGTGKPTRHVRHGRDQYLKLCLPLVSSWEGLAPENFSNREISAAIRAIAFNSAMR